jgi:two-component system, cell cycle sensor histidine kinase and response regulator CckA
MSAVVRSRAPDADEALRASEVRYRRLFEAGHDGILILNAVSGEITAVNPFLAQLLGYSVAEMIGKKLWELGPFEDAKKGKVAFTELQRQEYIRYDDLPLETKDGRIIEVEFVSNVYESDQEHVIQCNIRDLTDSKRADRSRQASDQRYRSLFEHAADGILIADKHGCYLDANRAVCAMLGYSREELIGLQSADIVMPSEVAHIGSALAAITAMPNYSREWEFRRQDGSSFCADVMAAEMPDGNLMAFVRDNTARNSATEAVRAADERMRFALHSAQVGIWDMNYATGVLDWSDEMEAQYGLAPGSFGKTFESFVECIYPDDRAAVLAAVSQASSTGSAFSVVHRASVDGKIRWLSGAGRFITDANGKPLRAVGISQDVTGRRLLESQFQQAQKMEAVGRLAGSVAHDFNNLLTVILGFCEILLEDAKPDAPARREITEIQKAGTRAAGLTRQLLAFSRHELTELKVLDLNDILIDMRPMLARLIKEDVKIVFATAPALGCVMADRGQIEQVVLNLAVNAQDAMPGGGQLTIQTANRELDDNYASTHFDVKPGAYVALTVTDSGMGMSPAIVERLFEPFFTTKGVGKGTGLGLASVHGIVKSSGGSVHIYSEPGQGSSFTVYLPQVASGERPSAVRAPLSVATGTETVLVVEDAEALRELTTRLLERQGYTVIAAASAAEARRLFEWNPSIAVVLTDVVMPECSGPKLASQLAERRSGFKVIYMSGYTDEAISHHGVLMPGIAFLHKPFTSQILGRKIRETLDQ